jgi:hypothetical protein
MGKSETGENGFCSVAPEVGDNFTGKSTKQLA